MVLFSFIELGSDIWSDDDSDFDLNDYSSDSDGSEYEDDDRLCNTMVLSGPNGVGKTATVNALATELGYKVLTVFGITIFRFLAYGIKLDDIMRK